MNAPPPPTAEASAEDGFRLKMAERGLSEQLESVDAAQMRASVLIAAVAIVAGWLGVSGLDGRSAAPWADIALVIGWCSLIVCAVALVFVIWPRKLAWNVLDLGDKTAKQMTRSVTASIQEKIDTNRDPIKWLWLGVRVSIIALTANALAWGALATWRPT